MRLLADRAPADAPNTYAGPPRRWLQDHIMRKSFLITVALVVLAGCGGANSASLQPASHQKAPRTIHRPVTTTTQARVKTPAPPTRVPPTTVPLIPPPIARPVAAVAPTPPPTPPPTPAPPAPSAGVSSSGAEGALVANINGYRGAHGLAALAM